MKNIFKYLGAFFLVAVAASLAFCSVGVYNGMQTVSRLLAGADNYTCRQFMYDMTDPHADKAAAILIATTLYGGLGQADTLISEANRQDIVDNGAEAAVAKTTALCQGKPDERLLNLFAQSLVSPTAAGVSSSMVPSAVSPTQNTKN